MDLTVVIPTRDRPARVKATVEALERQRLDGARAEVVVVENGAPRLGKGFDDREGPLAVRLLHESRPGTSRAFNRGLREAGAKTVLFIGDDTVPADDDLLLRHIELHRAGGEEIFAVLGRVEWDPRTEVTDFMRFTHRAGFQFSFDRLSAGPVSPARYFYTSHVSVDRAALAEVGGFDEGFPFMLEHVDLGIRLEREGLSVDYHPELVVLHDHFHDLDSFAQRMRAVGEAARKLRERWPDDCPEEVQAPDRRWRALGLASPLARAMLRGPLPQALKERAWTAVLLGAYSRGYQSGAG